MTSPEPVITVNGRRWIDGKPCCPTCLAERCDCIQPVREPLHLVVVNGGVCSLAGPEQEPRCVFCEEPAGGCSLTGGIPRCEGTNEFYALQLEAAAAPRIQTPFRTGGA